MIYILLAVIALVAFGMLYAKKKLDAQKPKHVSIESLFPDPPDKKEIEQDKKNCEVIANLIKGHYGGVSGKAKKKSIKAFEKWQQKQKTLFQMANSEMLLLRKRYIDKQEKNLFRPKFVQVSPCKETHGRPEGWKLFLKNGFTEPFPSLHDMDDWAITCQITDFFILNNIDPEESKQFVFHEKRHYVNHIMTYGIIQFDLYKILPTPELASSARGGGEGFLNYGGFNTQS